MRLTNKRTNPNSVHQPGTSQGGFTIVELMIATTVFSVILLIATIGMLTIGRSYYKGITSAAVQNTARAIADDVGQSIQFGGGTPIDDVTGGIYCVGGRLYEYRLNQPLTRTNWVLKASTLTGGCADLSSKIDEQEMVGLNMRLMKFTVDQDPGNGSLYNITVRVAQGDNDLLTDTDGNGIADSCVVGAGGQFCAVSEVSTTVQKRLN